MEFEFDSTNMRKRISEGPARTSVIWEGPKLPRPSGSGPDWGPAGPSRSLPSPVGFGYESIDIRNLPEGQTLNSTMILKNVCRICETYYPSGPQLLPLFCCTKLTARPLASIINEYLPKLMTLNDGLPMVMCITCATKVQEWRVIRFKCMEAQAILSKHVGLRNTMPELPSYIAPPDRTIHLVDLTDSTDDEDAEPPPRVAPTPLCGSANMPAAT